MLTVYLAAFALSLLVLAAAWAMQPPEPETPYPARHRTTVPIGDTSWTC